MFDYKDLKNLIREVLNEQLLSLKEGGNIFKSQEDEPLTKRIDRADVDPTLEWLENEVLNFDGVILTKLDGDTRGGAALSIKSVVIEPSGYKL